MALDVKSLQVGQKVSIARASWGVGTHYIVSQGVYVVEKADRVKVVLRRESDGHKRVWSLKHNAEVVQAYDGKKKIERGTFIESIEDMVEREKKAALARDKKRMWSDIEQAAQNKDIVALRRALAELERFDQ